MAHTHAYFRHTFSTRAQNVQIDEPIAYAMTGHSYSNNRAGDTYRHGYELTVLNDNLQKITFDVPDINLLTYQYQSNTLRN